MSKKRIEEIISLPHNPEDIESYTKSLKKNLFIVLSDKEKKDGSLPEGFEVFMENLDHGLEHTYNVYQKALEIADKIEEETKENINRSLIYIMAAMHDAGRFHISSNKDKQDKCEKQHNKCGVAQIKLFQKRLRQRWYELDDSQVQDITNYIQNHDYLTERLDGSTLKEPESLEWQIVRLADRISTNIIKEVRRYWETGKRRNTPLLSEKVSFQDRINFSFDQIDDYIRSGKLDQMFFFLALISVSSGDFSHPKLAEIYADWSKEKQHAVDEILKIAEEEGYDIKKIKSIIDNYLEYFGIKLY